MKKVSPYYKAIAGFVSAALVAYLRVASDGVTSDEWLTILAAGLGAGIGVYFAPKNKPKATNEGGYASTDLIGVAILVGVVLLLFGVHFR